MDISAIVIIEGGLVFGCAVGWGLWELYCLRRDRLKAEQKSCEDETDG